jgi:integrase
MAFVRKRKGKWRIRFIDQTGIQVERATLAATKVEAQRMADDLERQAEKVRLGLEHGLRSVSVAQAYEKEFKPVVQGRAGFAAMDSRFRQHIIPELGDRLVHQVTPADVLRLLAKMERDEYAPATREHVRVELSSFFTYMIEKAKAFTGDNPAREVEKVRIPERPPRFLEADEVTAALSHVPDRWRGFIAVAVYTGLRFSELRRLRVREVLLERRLLEVWFTKNGKVRYVPIPDQLVPYLKVELGRARSEWLFPRPNGKQLTKDCGALRMFRRALRRAGIIEGYDHLCRTRGKGRGCGFVERRADSARAACPKCGRQLEVKAVPKPFAIKDLRSTFGTHAAEQTGDLRVVQRGLGHRTIDVTEKKYAFARDRHFVNQLAGLSFGPARSGPVSKDDEKQQGETTSNVMRLTQAAKRS